MLWSFRVCLWTFSQLLATVSVLGILCGHFSEVNFIVSLGELHVFFRVLVMTWQITAIKSSKVFVGCLMLLFVEGSECFF